MDHHQQVPTTDPSPSSSHSYPPLFLHPHSPPPPPPPPPNPLEIPLLDFLHLTPNLLTHGVFRLANHGVPPALSAALFALAKSFMARPFDQKVNAFPDAPVKYFYGTPAVTLNLREVNWLEGLHVPVGTLLQSSAPDSDTAVLGDFRNLAIEYCKHMARIARTLFDAMATDLNLDAEQRAAYTLESKGLFRVYRYPICPDPSSYLGMEAHTDSSMLTILNEDDVGGLQVFHEDAWFDIVPVPGTLIVNLGDLMQVISNDRYKSVKHRVLASGVAERLSLGYFVFPEEDSVLRSSTYRQFTLKEFRAQVQEDIMITGSKVGIKQFKKERPDLCQ